MEQQPPSIPEIVLPAGWNDPDHREPACEVCFWNGDPDNLYNFPIANDFMVTSGRLSRLESSSTHDCVRCRIIALNMIQALYLFSREISIQDNLINIGASYDLYTIFRFKNRKNDIASEYADDWTICSTLFIPQQSCEIGAPRGIPRLRCVNVDAPPDTSSDRSFLWAKDQIESHQDCCQPKIIDGAFSPTRLINVGSIDTDRDVVLDENIPSASRYVALSYCWGSDTEIKKIYQIDKTTSATLPDYKKRIPWDRIPRTIQHAVTFTRRLGIKYLWVDRFCIIQGDKDDWMKESGRMFDVFRHSYVTLAAVWGRKSDSGLFSISEHVKPYLLANLSLNGQYWPLYMQQCHGPYFLWVGISEHEVLFTRAWTYQERLIAPRVLYFHKNELAFECFCHSACECGLTEYDLSTYASQFYKHKFYEDVIKPQENSTARDLESQPDRSDIGNFPDQRWREIVHEYSKLKLTESKDRLAAIQAVADQFQVLDPEQQYLSGLWSGSLHKDLLWNHLYLSKRNNEMPTWSWASIDQGPLWFPDFRGKSFTPTAEVVKYTCEKLELRGRLIPSWLVKEIDIGNWGTGYISITGGSGPKLPLTGSNRIEIPIDDITVLSAEPPRQKVYLFEVARQNEGLECIHFLILRRTDNPNDPNEFVRVGCFYMYCRNHNWSRGWSLHGLKRIGHRMEMIRDKARWEHTKAMMKILGRTEEIKLK